MVSAVLWKTFKNWFWIFRWCVRMRYIMELVQHGQLRIESMRKAGVLVIDLGGGTTDFTLYHNGVLQHCGSFTAGGSYVTNDIAKGLQIPEAQAESLKKKEGSAL